MTDQIQKNFEAFDAANPQVWRLFCMFTRQLIGAGHKRGSAKMVLERIRWETTVETNSAKPVKLNNNYTSRYARKWECEQPEGYANFFRTRKLNADSADSTSRVSFAERIGL